jgi:predicted DsbA family dithiol-disulfide isomerase
MSSSLTIDIVSDHVCPWCYVGKRRLEKALARRPDIDAKINWLPFQLSPDMPREGRDRMEYFKSIFGEERAQTILDSLSDTGQEEGIAFALKPGARSPNTLSAHVLMYWAGEAEGVDQNELAEKLFAAHHVDCEDLGNPEVLARIADECGMEGAEVLQKLADGIDEDVVTELMNQARAAGVSGVPFFIVNKKLALSGAQPPEVLLQALEQAAAEQGE